MAYSKLYLLPVAVFVLVPLSFLITYIMAVKLGHVDPRLPYISDTGSISPESCLFAQFCNTYAAMTLLCIYIKYRQVQEAMRLYVKDFQTLNKVALVLGVICCLGLQLVGNFQESNVLIVHGIGAALCFVAGTVYFMMQCVISHRLPEIGPAKWILRLRQFMTLLCVVTMLSTLITASISLQQYNGEMTDGGLPQWKPENDGWELHLVSSGSEWILAITFCALILTFVPEFAKTDSYNQRWDQKLFGMHQFGSWMRSDSFGMLSQSEVFNIPTQTVRHYGTDLLFPQEDINIPIYHICDSL